MAVRDDIIAAIEALRAGEGGGIPGAGQQAGRAPGGVLAGPTGQLSSPTTPANFNSNIGPWAGNIGTAIGAGMGVPGIGMAAGALGQMADLGRYSGVLGQNNISMSPNYGQAALYGASAMPFGLGSLFGTSARQQSENARRDYLGAVGPTPNNVTTMPSPVGPVDWATDPMNFDANSPSKDFGPGGFGSTGQDTGGGISTSGGQDPGAGGKGESSGGGAKGEGGGGWFAKGGIVPPPRIGMPNPRGPDDQTAHVRTGEMILTPEQAQRLAGMVAGGDKQRLIAALKAA